ncbi:DUF1150 family protein [Pararhodobacter sp. SW119]|uniref:DUF1150 family protein n=1 Tax=Pararhodobacter sp. SW119 TaxID=2780075 RepID=UPI001ADF2C0A|nr:DUF1150 family protein [Pararhodobacter sp. SW119]
MKTPYPDLPDSRIAYIRQVPLDALPDEIRAQLPGVVEVYGIHTEEGECLALAKNRKMAFVLARQHDLAPVSAH